MHLANKQKIIVMSARVVAFAALIVAITWSGSTFAQSTSQLGVTYFDNNGVSGAPDAYIHVLNVQSDNGADNCADIYVWRSDQELSECCTCPITQNGLLTFTVAAATANPGDGNPTPPTSGAIEIITDKYCMATNVTPRTPFPAWATHVSMDSATGAFDVTETPFSRATLSDGELSEAENRCSFILENGSGHGQCNAICSAVATGARPEISR